MKRKRRERKRARQKEESEQKGTEQTCTHRGRKGDTRTGRNKC